MGQEISTEEFKDEHFARFREHLNAEMGLLRNWFAGKKFCADHLQCGLELEAWITHPDGSPAPDNQVFLAAVDRAWVVPEFSKFNFELNVAPQYITGKGLADMRAELYATWHHCEEIARQLDRTIVSIGTLPTATDAMLCKENMSSVRRYAALTDQVLRLRGGQAVRLEITGEDVLETVHHDLMLEAAATSLQVHLKVPQATARRYYNASIIASAFTVALAANAPLLFGKRLWEDTRIPVFEQAVDTLGPEPRVTFGAGYVRESLLEIFERNVNLHRILLPSIRDEAPARMPHVRMHNGTIWHWNRPLIGFESDGTPHLRIEHRPMSASSSVADLFADMEFYLGLVHSLATDQVAPESLLPFDDAKQNFYSAAQHGFLASVKWIDGQMHILHRLLSDQVLPLAIRGMENLGMPSAHIDTATEVLNGRIATRQNGAAWQRKHFAEYDGDPYRLLQQYIQHQLTGAPVHTWT